MNTKHTLRIPVLMTTALVFASCVDARPIRNGLDDSSIYLTKSNLTAPNPKMGEEVADDGWLYQVTVVKASSPNLLKNYIYPGLTSAFPTLDYVKFRFKENALQMIDGHKLQSDDAGDPNDDLATNADRVMLEFKGDHVDVKLRESLNGERTNFLEENREESWQSRQKFKIDFENTSLDPLTSSMWIYGELVRDCARVTSTNLVPDSFEWDEESQYMSFVLEVNYTVNLFTQYGFCHDLVSIASDKNSTTLHYRFSFYRPGPSTYEPQVIAEKDPVNKKYGSFQTFNVFRDHDSGLLSAVRYLMRWDPNREEPAVWYFHPGYPEKFKPMWQKIKEDTNKVLADAGAKLRVDFKEWNAGGIERHYGDIRYSFLVWNQDFDVGWAGAAGPPSSDPRTGEIISANITMFNYSWEIFRYLIQDYLEENGAVGKPDPDQAWEDITCTAGETVAPVDDTQRLRSTLWQEMRRVMEMPEPAADEDPVAQMVPTPRRSRDGFNQDYNRLLGEARFAEPRWNEYVYSRTKTTYQNLASSIEKDLDFEKSMTDIALNQDPFGGAALYTQQGIEKQLDFLENFRDWRKNHDTLMADRERIMHMRNIFQLNPAQAVGALERGARKCKDDGRWESNQEYTDRVIYDIIYGVSIHEFGHNMSLRHNFYGSADAEHIPEGEYATTVMDYSGRLENVLGPFTWGPYDQAALTWIYGTDTKRDEVMQEDFLYCTDEHRLRSPLCQAWDTGTTPAEVVMSAIERYDWMYKIRNRRAFRTFWDTSSYIWNVYYDTFPLLRMWYLAIFDWGSGGIQDTLKRLDQLDPNRPVLTDNEYTENSLDFYNDISAANEMTIAFYDAVINQPASFRNYQTEFDPYYGDVLRMGIILDKLFTTFAFMDLQEVYNYDPNVYTYAALYDSPFGGRAWALSQRVLDNMLGANYDTFAWFKYYALGIFASVTNTNLVGSAELKDRIAIKRYENTAELLGEFGQTALDQATDIENTSQVFTQNGEEYVYTYLPDRSWHLVANKSRSPVSFQYMKDYNEDLNSAASESLDNFGLKILLAYYEYFNNFVGF